MKKIILTLALILSSAVMFAQSEEETLNKWIDTYSNLNANKNWQEMISSFDQCRSELPNWNFAYYYKGVAEFQVDNYQGAVSDLTSFISSSPEDKDALQKALMFRVLSFNKLGYSKQAIDDANTLVSMNANNKEALLEKANAYMALKEYSNYIEVLKQVLNLDNNNADISKNIAAAYAIGQDWANAITYYSKAIEINPNEATYYEDRAFANYSLKTPEGYQNALNDYIKAEELGVKTAKLYQYRATIYGMLNNFEQAITDYNSYLTLNADDINIIYQRGNAYFKLKKYTEAISDMDKVVDSDKAQKNMKIQALQRRGASKQALKDVKGAQADMEMIKQLKGAK